MGLRENLNKSKWLVLIVVIAAVLLAVYTAIRQVSGPPKANSAFFSTDDGATWFEDSIDKVPPFMVGDKEAVLAHVFICNGKKFVGYVEKYTSEYKKLVEKANAEKVSDAQPANGLPNSLKANVALMAPGGRLFKKPGDKEWHLGMSAKGTELTYVKCSDGSMAEPVTLPGYLGH